MTTSARILVVDDQQVNLDVLTLLLQTKGYDVLQARDGQTALGLVYEDAPDMILLDVMMPGLSGRDVTRQIKGDPRLPFIPIILVTAQSELDDKIGGLEAGADDFLSKPVQMRELLAKVSALLRLKQAQDALVAERNKTNLLYRIQQELTRSLDLDQVIGDTIQLMLTAVQATQGSMTVFDSEHKVWRRILTERGSATTHKSVVPHELLEEGLVNLAIRTRQTQVVRDAANDLRWTDEQAGVVVRSAVILPLQHVDVVLGVLTLTHPTPNYFTVTQLDLLHAAVGQISAALHNASLYSRLREAEAGREQFLHMLTHDLRAPLSGILGCLHILQMSPQSADSSMFIEMAEKACTTQERLIDDLLDVYKAQSGFLDLVVEPLSLAPLGAEVTATMRGAALERSLELVVTLPEAPLVLADGSKILRVLLNLVGNAVKFTRSGGVYVTTSRDSKWLTISVRDTGGGISTDQLDKIFDRFFQGVQAGARRGTGLGLTFCREVVAAHGGRIWAESTLGEGTEMLFTLPYVTQEEA